jgi:hypothetical protein
MSVDRIAFTLRLALPMAAEQAKPQRITERYNAS